MLETLCINSVKNSPKKSSSEYVVIWLHGLGASNQDFFSLAADIQNRCAELNLSFIFPNAPLRPITLNHGYVMRAWYDITGLDLNSREDRQGLEDTYKKISLLINQQIQSGVLAEHIFLGGFSQGAAMSLYTGLRYPQTLGGIIALSGYLPFHQQLHTEKNSASQGVPIFIGQGSHDVVVPPQWGKISANALKSVGYSIDFHEYPMGHQVCQEEIKEMSQWILKAAGV